jgi:branched-chain amino acid transport system permease protein
MDWDFFVQQVVNGVTLGSMYALIALGYTMVYGILKLLNFAHGEVYMMAAFAGFGVMTALGGPDDLIVPVGVMIALMFLAGMASACLLAMGLERFAYRRLRDAPRIAPLITALGASFFLQATALLLFGAQRRSYESNEYLDVRGGIHWGPLNISPQRLMTIVGTVVLMVVLWQLVSRSKLGKAMRAVSFDREAAAMMGIDVDRVIVATFAIGGILAGAAGVMFGLVYFSVYHLMGFGAGLKGFTAAVIGGIGSIPGAMLGGLVIGLAESFSAAYISSTFQDLIVFSILIVVMLVRPTGLLGRADIKKV